MKLNIVTVKRDSAGILKEDLSGRKEDPENMRKYRAEMMRLCRQFKGIGLAANQAGLAYNMFLAMPGAGLLPSNSAELVVNPQWEPVEGAGVFDSVEGCLSLPGKSFVVRRHARIRASWDSVSGHRVVRTLKGMAAKVFQHECDHLRGLTLEDTGTETQ